MLQIFGDVLSILSGIGSIRHTDAAKDAGLPLVKTPVRRRPSDMPRLG